MCGITGAFNGSIRLDKLSKRGPDNSGTIEHGEVIFGHTRLSIIDLSEESNQPIENNRYVITYNGEWYDFRRYYPLEASDTTALLQSIKDNGFENTLTDINGMFAIACYDRLEKKIYCAVDRFGQKPLYYYHNENTFAFGSSPASLLHYKDSWDIDKDALQSYWLLGSVMGEQSIWRGIKKLCGSEMLVYDLQDNTITIKRYYEPKFMENADKYIEELVLDAINTVKIADVPISIFLSGGIDSTLVASQFKGGNAIHLDGPERAYAEFVANKYNINFKVVHPNTIDLEQGLTDYSMQCGEPSMAAIIPYITAKEVSKYFKVAITANGADELFFGYDRTEDCHTDKQHKHIFRDIEYKGKYPLYGLFNNKDCGRMWELGAYVQYDLNKTLDFASMCHSLEVRSPFLDHRLVECALSIPMKDHKFLGNKSILKRMLMKMGFTSKFVNRKKQGFSLHEKPHRLDELKDNALNWCIAEGWLDVDKNNLNFRDYEYLSMSALGFYYFYRFYC